MSTATLPDVISFDLDGILINSHGLHDLAFIAALRDLKLEDAANRYAAATNESISTKEKLKALGIPEFYPQVKEAKDRRFLETINLVEFNPWLSYDLRRLNELGSSALRFVVVTNCSQDVANLLLTKSGIFGKIPAVAADGVINTKPHPALYHKAMELVGFNPETELWLALEDSDNGVAAAQAAGLNVIKTNFNETKERLRLCAF